MLLGWCLYILIRTPWTPRRTRKEIRPIQERDIMFHIIIQSRRHTSCASNLLQKLCVSTICFTKEEEEKENHYLNYRICLLSNRRRREPLLTSSTICFIEEQEQEQEKNCKSCKRHFVYLQGKEKLLLHACERHKCAWVMSFDCWE